MIIWPVFIRPWRIREGEVSESGCLGEKAQTFLKYGVFSIFNMATVIFGLQKSSESN